MKKIIVIAIMLLLISSLLLTGCADGLPVDDCAANETLKQLWITLRTPIIEKGGTDANFRLEFSTLGRDIDLPDQPGDPLEQGTSTTYYFDIPEPTLYTNNFVDGDVLLVNDNTGDYAGWFCKSVLIIGIGEDGKYYPLVAMSDVNQWLDDEAPYELWLELDILERHQIGVKW